MNKLRRHNITTQDLEILLKEVKDGRVEIEDAVREIRDYFTCILKSPEFMSIDEFNWVHQQLVEARPILMKKKIVKSSIEPI